MAVVLQTTTNKQSKVYTSLSQTNEADAKVAKVYALTHFAYFSLHSVAGKFNAIFHIYLFQN